MVPYTIPPEKRGGMCALLAMAWDGQWFLKVYEEYGWDEAVRLNARVRAAFGRIEMRRTLRALGKQAATDLGDAIQVILAYFRDVLAAGFDAEFAIAGDRAEITVTRCAAHRGSQRAGIKTEGQERHDQACIACQGLWHAYLEVLLPDTPAEVELIEWMGQGAPECHITIQAGRSHDSERQRGATGFSPGWGETAAAQQRGGHDRR